MRERQRKAAALAALMNDLELRFVDRDGGETTEIIDDDELTKLVEHWRQATHLVMTRCGEIYAKTPARPRASAASDADSEDAR